MSKQKQMMGVLVACHLFLFVIDFWVALSYADLPKNPVMGELSK